MNNNYQSPRVEDEANGHEDQQGGGPAQNGDEGAAAEQPQQQQQQQQQQMTINFVDSRGFEVSFKLKPTTKMAKAMNAFSARTERDRATLRFLVDGSRVLDDDTPASLDIEDGDKVEVHTEQIGGA